MSGRTEGAVARDSGPHLAPVLRRGVFPTWWWTVLVVTATAAVAAVDPAALRQLPAAGLGAGVLLAFVLAGELRPIIASTRTDPEGINLATAFLFAALLRWGIEAALTAVVVATLVGEAARRKRVYAALFNVAQYTLSYLAAWWVLCLGDWVATPASPADLAPHDLPLVALAGATYHVMNLLLVGTALALADRQPWWATVTGGIGWYTSTTGAVLALAPLVVVVLTASPGFLPLVALPLVLLYTTAKLALEREERSHTDPLTGVANRDRLEQLVAARLADPAEHRPPVALCLIDLDRFKEVNDALGHATGDALLQAVAARLVVAVAGAGAVARLGGDEFVLLLEVERSETAAAEVERLATALSAPYEIAGVRLEAELSVGVVLLGEDGDDVETLLRRADAAMYEAKAAGEVARRYTPALERHTPSRLQLLADLRSALERGELVLHYQPQVTIATGEVVGVEALVRWQHPTRGLLLPARFLPLAERTATMRLVTAAVLELALEQQARWRAAGLRVPLAINASMHDVADAGFADRVLAGLRRHGLGSADLHVEITEQVLVGDPSVVVRTLGQLRAAGVVLSLDDFGTGHASLTRLARLPVDVVKLDRQFVSDLTRTGADTVAIVRTIVELTTALGARSLAEGVETSDQLRLLADLGCEAVQGWLVAPPMPADEATRWLLDRAPSAQLAPSVAPADDR